MRLLLVLLASLLLPICNSSADWFTSVAQVDNSTISKNSSNQIQVKSGGVGATQLATGAVGTTQLASGAVTAAKASGVMGKTVTNPTWGADNTAATDLLVNCNSQCQGNNVTGFAIEFGAAVADNSIGGCDSSSGTTSSNVSITWLIPKGWHYECFNTHGAAGGTITAQTLGS